jgi:hypothetical protein
VESKPHGVELVEHFKNNLRPKTFKETWAVSEMRQKWYFLREAIDFTLKRSDIRRQQIPFHIAGEYLKLRTNPSPLITIIAEGDALPSLASLD